MHAAPRLAPRSSRGSFAPRTMKIPYGEADFAKIRRRGSFYVDKTPFLPVLESDEFGYKSLVFLRPRRFGKSL